MGLSCASCRKVPLESRVFGLWINFSPVPSTSLFAVRLPLRRTYFFHGILVSCHDLLVVSCGQISNVMVTQE